MVRNLAARENEYGQARVELPQFLHQSNSSYAPRMVSDYQVNLMGIEGFQTLNTIRRCKNSIACTLKNHFTDRKLQFLIVNAEDSGVGAHSDLPGT